MGKCHHGKQKKPYWNILKKIEETSAIYKPILDLSKYLLTMTYNTMFTATDLSKNSVFLSNVKFLK